MSYRRGTDKMIGNNGVKLLFLERSSRAWALLVHVLGRMRTHTHEQAEIADRSEKKKRSLSWRRTTPGGIIHLFCVCPPARRSLLRAKAMCRTRIGCRLLFVASCFLLALRVLRILRTYIAALKREEKNSCCSQLPLLFWSFRLFSPWQSLFLRRFREQSRPSAARVISSGSESGRAAAVTGGSRGFRGCR